MSGSGAGGRIAIHILKLNHYRGRLKAVGGSGTGMSAGGPGSVFIETKTRFGYHRKLIIDGNSAKPAKPFQVSEQNPSTPWNSTELNNATFAFDIIEILKQVNDLESSFGGEGRSFKCLR